MAKREKSEAAEKIEKAAKEKKAGAPKAKKGNIFKRIGKWFAKFGKDFKGETKKITWPGAKMVLKSTLVVIVAIAVIGIVVFFIDWGLSSGINGIRDGADKYQEKKTSTSQAAEENSTTAASSEATSETSAQSSAE